MKNIQKNKQYKRNRGKILLFVIFTMAILMLNLVSAELIYGEMDKSNNFFTNFADSIFGGSENNMKVSGMRIVETKINEDSLNVREYSDGILGVRNVFTNKREGIEQEVYIENKENINRLYNYSTIIEIDYSEVRWAGIKYQLTAEPIKFSYIIDEITGDKLYPNIFFDDIFNKRISYRDVIEKGGYALAYEKDGKYFIELRIDNLKVNSKEEYYIDPTYTNATGGFSTSALGSTGPRGLSVNATDVFWADTVKNRIFHTKTDGTNITTYGNFECNSASLSIGSCFGVYLNESKLWITNNAERAVHTATVDGLNSTGGFSATPFTPSESTLAGVTLVGDKLYIVGYGQQTINNFNIDGTNSTGAFPTSSLSPTAPTGIVKLGTKFYISFNVKPYTAISDINGVNTTDFIPISTFGMSDVQGIAYNGSTFFMNDYTDKFMYKVDCVGEGCSTTSVINITVNLTSPINNVLITVSNITFNASYIYSGLTITNGTYYAWYNNGSIFNKTTLVVDDALNYSSLNITGFVLGSYKWNVYGCGENATATICSFGSFGNYSFNVGGAILNENYSQLTYETASEKFMANFSIFPGSNIISVYLVYNGTHHVITDITNYGSSVEIKKTIDINLNKYDFKNESKQFYWSFIFSNGGLVSQNTSLRYQEVKPLNIVYCNNTYLMNSLNFTSYDETNPNPKINTTFHTFWTFWSGTGTITKNYSFEDTTLGNSSFKFCISPNQSSIQTNLISEITSPNYFPRTYYLTNATINNITQEVPIRLINTTLGVKFFHTIREGTTRVSEATVIISKFDVGIGTWVTVGIRKSDDQGEFIEYLELDKDYKYSITKNGDFLGTLSRTSTCQATPCLMNLEISDGNVELWKGINDVYAANVVYNLSYSKYTKNVTYTFVDTSGLATYFRLQVNKISANETGTIICNTTLYATFGTITCSLAGQTGSFVAKGYVSRGPEKFIGVLYGLLNSIAETIGKDEGLFFSFMIVVVVGLIGAWNPAVGVLLAGISFIFAGLIGFVMISITSMILIGILVVILLIKIGKNGV